MKPIFSIMIPTFGRPQLLELALRSALHQHGDIAYEVVVVDNDSEHVFDAEAVVAKFSDQRLRYVRNEQNLGMCGNWNRCLELAAGDWLTILHDDDQLHPDYVRSVCAAAATAPQPVIIGCGVLEVTHANYVEGTSWPAAQPARTLKMNMCDVLRGCPYYVAGVAMQARQARQLQGFDAGQYPSMDYDLWFRMIDAGPALLLPVRLAVYRKFENESARPEVLAGFLQRSSEIRQQIIGRLPLWLRSGVRIYSAQRVAADQAVLETAWGIRIGSAGSANPGLPAGIARRCIGALVKVAVVLLSGRRFYRLAVIQ